MRQIALGLILTGLLATSACGPRAGRHTAEPGRRPARRVVHGRRTLTLTQAAAAAAPNRRCRRSSARTSRRTYFFRGYRQESDPALTFQPFVDVAIAGESASFNVGLWNSFHTGSLKDGGAGFYETDFYAAVTVGKLKATYTAYLYPKIR